MRQPTGVSNMKTALSVWNGRIAPVFDTARDILVIDVESGRAVAQTAVTLPDGLPVQKVRGLAELGVGALVCGAISWPLHAMVTASGIRVVPFIAGAVDDVVSAWLSGRIEQAALAMPGCGWRRGWSGRETASASDAGSGWGQGGARRGRGWGRGRTAAGRGAGAGGPNPGQAGRCICLVCGHREPHERGVPCAERTCPSCGTHLVRES
jgi:predicted Fe-Mo cluster-binding NifX family protein